MLHFPSYWKKAISGSLWKFCKLVGKYALAGKCKQNCTQIKGKQIRLFSGVVEELKNVYFIP